jgi:ribosomal protein L7/L12
MNALVLVILLVVIVVIAFGVSLALRRRRENPMRSLGEMGMRGVNQDEIVHLLTRKQKIEAIKRYREMTGVGLAEAKAAVEQMERELLLGPQVAMGVQSVMGAAGGTVGLDESAADLFAVELQQLLLAGRKLEAIKLYREKTGASLAEAKAVIDRML